MVGEEVLVPSPAPPPSPTIGETIASFFKSDEPVVVTQQPTTTQKTPTPPVAGQFTRNLTIGSQGEEVRRLQQFLNQNDCPVSQTGAGSPGQESTYFGQKTQQAVICYQRANGITPAVGYVGPKTRAHINSRITPPPATPPIKTPTPQPTGTPVISAPPVQARVTPRTYAAPTLGTSPQPPNTQEHSLGDRHPTIREAQTLLNKTPCKVATTGAGSAGQETDYFGQRTQQAIRCYQQRNNLPITGTLTDALLAHLRTYQPTPTPQPVPTPQPTQQPPKPRQQDTPQPPVSSQPPVSEPSFPLTQPRGNGRGITAPSL